MGFQFDSAFFIYELMIAIQYIPVVLLLSLVPLAVGLLAGSVIAVVRLFEVRGLAPFFALVVVFLRGVPLLLQLTILYLLVHLGWDAFAQQYGLATAAKDISYTLIAVIGLSIHATVYLSEVVRTALKSVPSGQYEAAYSVGMNRGQLLRRIVFPQALPVAIPLIGSNCIALIKGSAIASLISVVEIVNATLFEANANYKFLEAYLAAALVYWGLCVVVEQFVVLLESRLSDYGKGGMV